MNGYSELLKRPEWQKKRLKILERDNWSCQNCFNKDNTLNVHHKIYISTYLNPWDYPDILLITLCDNCHEKDHLLRKELEEKILRFTRIRFTLNDLDNLVRVLIK